MKSESAACSVMSDSMLPHGLQPVRLLCPWNSSGKNTGMGIHSLLQGIVPTQGLNLDLLHCRLILYGLRHQRDINNQIMKCKGYHMRCAPAQLLSYVLVFVSFWTVGDFTVKNTGVSCHLLLQGIFSTQNGLCISCVSCIASRFFAD